MRRRHLWLSHPRELPTPTAQNSVGAQDRFFEAMDPLCWSPVFFPIIEGRRRLGHRGTLLGNLIYVLNNAYSPFMLRITRISPHRDVTIGNRVSKIFYKPKPSSSPPLNDKLSQAGEGALHGDREAIRHHGQRIEPIDIEASIFCSI